jgi:arylsulfatase A-like enzyme
MLIGLIVALAALFAEATDDSKPNILLIVADDLGYGDFVANFGGVRLRRIPIQASTQVEEPAARERLK